MLQHGSTKNLKDQEFDPEIVVPTLRTHVIPSCSEIGKNSITLKLVFQHWKHITPSYFEKSGIGKNLENFDLEIGVPTLKAHNKIELLWKIRNWGIFKINLTLNSMVFQLVLGGSCGDSRFSNQFFPKRIYKCHRRW